ncbi:proline-rich receptor-like protein kinase perk5 [Anaeramoeba flamelloides]|uniref:Proline-rich receptor-like protein kinase perk5 n=1 Tax=Anaeramoeba flamelloides TaxID=1746091 RepID=A0ABQ8Z3B2_9EUKA|nr:proline-rich receptor-like protein kinase perk5 [Anaeramoeba flamelloides]
MVFNPFCVKGIRTVLPKHTNTTHTKGTLTYTYTIQAYNDIPIHVPTITQILSKAKLPDLNTKVKQIENNISSHSSRRTSFKEKKDSQDLEINEIISQDSNNENKCTDSKNIENQFKEDEKLSGGSEGEKEMEMEQSQDNGINNNNNQNGNSGDEIVKGESVREPLIEIKRKKSKNKFNNLCKFWENLWFTIFLVFFICIIVVYLAPIGQKKENDNNKKGDEIGKYPYCSWGSKDDLGIDIIDTLMVAQASYQPNKEKMINYLKNNNFNNKSMIDQSQFVFLENSFYYYDESKKIVFIGIAGTDESKFYTFGLDAILWSSIACLQGFDFTFSFFSFANSKSITHFVALITDITHLFFPKMELVYQDLFNKITDKSSNDNPFLKAEKVICSGHSLGGGLCAILISSLTQDDVNLETTSVSKFKAVTYNAPNIYFSRKSFKFTKKNQVFRDNTNRNVRNVKVERDIVGMIDHPSGLQQYVKCNSNFPINCHSLTTTQHLLCNNCEWDNEKFCSK